MSNDLQHTQATASLMSCARSWVFKDVSKKLFCKYTFTFKDKFQTSFVRYEGLQDALNKLC